MIRILLLETELVSNMNYKLRYFIQVAKFKFGGVDTKLPIY